MSIAAITITGTDRDQGICVKVIGASGLGMSAGDFCLGGAGGASLYLWPPPFGSAGRRRSFAGFSRQTSSCWSLTESAHIVPQNRQGAGVPTNAPLLRALPLPRRSLEKLPVVRWLCWCEQFALFDHVFDCLPHLSRCLVRRNCPRR